MPRSQTFVFGCWLLFAVAACAEKAGTPSDDPDGGLPGDASAQVGDARPPIDPLALPPYLAGCQSLFAARIVELERGLDADFPLDCDAPLTLAVGTLAVEGGSTTPLCSPGQSANGCADELLADPPDRTTLSPGCLTGTGTNPGCLQAKWLPRCADGSDSCAVAEARCVDGTRGQIYLQGTPAAKNWVFRMDPGGSPCSGEKCWFNYRYLPSLGSLGSAKALSTLHPDGPSTDSVAGAGITSGNPASNELAAYNRVEVNRCGEFASDLEAEVAVGDGVSSRVRTAVSGELSPAELATLPVETRRSMVPAFHRGKNLWRATFHMLATTAGRDLDGDGAADVGSFADAEVVWIVAGSDGANWLIHGADLLADLVHEVAPNAEVRVAIDSFFKPGLDEEGRYATNPPANFNVYDHPYGVTGACGPLTLWDGLANAEVTNVSCSDANYQPSAIASPILGIFDRPHIDGRGLLLDASCVAHHAANPAPCYDGAHVLVHHVSTPHLIVADRNDPKVKTTELTYAGNGALGWPPGTQAYAKRVLELARDIERYHATAKREEGALPARSVGIFLRNGNRTGNPVHVFTGLDERMNLAMTPCNAAGTQVGASHTVGEVFRDFGDPAALPDPFLVEDPNDAAGTFWLSGSQCGAGPQ